MFLNKVYKARDIGLVT